MARLVCLMASVAWLSACAAHDDTIDGDTWQGQVMSYVADYADHSVVLHRLEDAEGRWHPIVFEGTAGAAGSVPPSGSRIRAWGRREGDTLRASGFSLAPAADIAAIARPLIDGPKKPTRRWAFVLVDVNGGGNKVDPVHAQDVLFGAERPDSIRSYFREVSYGVQDLDGQIFGPLPYTATTSCDTDEVVKALLPQIEGDFDNYLWFYGTRQPGCDWAGLGELGSAERPTKNSWYNTANSCTVLVQEPGHNFGMVHSSAVHCTLGGKPVSIAWPGLQTDVVCSNEEYGNVFDPMGGGDCYHMNGVQKAYQDWLSGCNLVKATTSGTFTIHPLESACEGAQILQIPFPTPRTLGSGGIISGYYLELRAPVGYRDHDLPPQVLTVIGNDVREAKRTGNRNWLVDMTPETPTVDDAALPVGTLFEDPVPDGPKFKVLSVDATKAVIEVQLSGSTADATQPGQGVCRDLSPFTAPGPDRCALPATPVPPPDAGVPEGGAANDAGATTMSPNAGADDGGPSADAAPDSNPSDAPAPAGPASAHGSAGGCALAGDPPDLGGPTLLTVALLGVGLARRRART